MKDTETIELNQRKPAWINGVFRAAPILLGYIPIGFAYGVLAQKAGLSVFNTLLMSLIVFAGSSQLIAVGLISAGLAPISIILTTFIVNLRHMLMSAALTPYLGGWRKIELAWFGFEITDETFALHANRFPAAGVQKAEAFAINVTSHAAWILGSLLGSLGSGLITDVEQYALDYALPAMFIALLVMQIKNKPQIAVAVISGILSVFLLLHGFNHWYVIMATIIGASFGVVVEKWMM